MANTKIKYNNVDLTNYTSNSDLIFACNDAGTVRTAIQVNGDEGSVTMPRQSFVFAYDNDAQTLSGNTTTTLSFNTTAADTLGEYNTSTYTFTAKDDGVYVAVLNVQLASSADIQAMIVTTGIGTVQTWAGGFNRYADKVAAIVKLSAGQTIIPQVWVSATRNTNPASAASSLSIAKLS